MLYQTVEGDTLPYICWKHFGEKPGAVEAVLRANRDLAELGHIYPAGIQIWLPDISDPEATVLRIWD